MGTPNNNSQGFKLKPYTILELSKIYGISYNTMKRWLKRIKTKIGKKAGYYFSVKQIKTIINEFGLPNILNLE